MFGDLRVSRFLQNGVEESQCGFEFRLYFSFSWSSGPRAVVCLLLIWPFCREICLLYRFSLLIESDFFYREGHGLAEKFLLIIFIF